VGSDDSGVEGVIARERALDVRGRISAERFQRRYWNVSTSSHSWSQLSQRSRLTCFPMPVDPTTPNAPDWQNGQVG
jgi:hypothetical protein